MLASSWNKELFYRYNLVFILPVFWLNMCDDFSFFFFPVTNCFLTVCMYQKLVFVSLTSWILLYKLKFNLKIWISSLVKLVLLLTLSMTACRRVCFSCPLVILFDLVSFSLSLSFFSSFLTCPAPSSSGYGLWLGRMNFSAGEKLSEILINFILLNPGYKFRSLHFLY